MSISSPPPPPSSGWSGRPLPSDQVGACLAALDEDLGKAVDAPVWSLDDARLSRRLGEALAVRARVDELVARLVGQVDERDLAKVMGASSTNAHTWSPPTESAVRARVGWCRRPGACRTGPPAPVNP